MRTSPSIVLVLTLFSATNALAEKPYEQPICKENPELKNNATLTLKHKIYHLETGNKDLEKENKSVPISVPISGGPHFRFSHR